MRRRSARLLELTRISLIAWIVTAAGASSGAASGSPEAAARPPARQGVLVELFTSQGCSSCPPADRFLTELAERDDLPVIGLSFHVDYWNYIGWTDPFSSAAWSQRQRRYAEALGSDRIYTPQMVIDGHLEDVGSKRSAVLGLVERARSRVGRVPIELFASLDSAGRLRVEAEVGRLELASKPFAVWVAVVESGLTTPVGRGENAAKTLRNDRVVRHLERLPESASSFEMPLPAQWRRERLSVVAFLQDSESLRVHGAVEADLTH